MIGKKIIWILVFFVFSSFVFSIGISPAESEFKGGSNVDFGASVWLINNDARELNVKVYVEGPFSQYIDIDQESLILYPEDESKKVIISGNVPIEIPYSGSINYIVFEETIIGNDNINTRIILKHKLDFKGDIPKKHVRPEIEFVIDDDEIELISKIENVGKKKIREVFTTFYVNDKKKETIELVTNKKKLEKNEDIELSENVDRENFEIGEYRVRAVTNFDTQEVEIIKDLIIGDIEVDLSYFNSYFISNQVNEYSIELFNKWNRKIEGIYGEIKIKNNDDELLSSFRTKSFEISALSSIKIEDFFNAKDIGIGDYKVEVSVYDFKGKKIGFKEFEIEFLEKQENMPLVGNAIANSESVSFSFKEVLLIMGCLMLVLLFVFVAYRYVHREEYE
jgi:hypothetical protein